MTPQQKIKTLIIQKAIELGYDAEKLAGDPDAAAQVLEEDSDWYQDCMAEVREGQYETGLPCHWSRHYESKAVAAQCPDGSWVGWTYWYGGGKHAEPEAIEWIDDAYDVECTEEEKLVVVREFKKVNHD